MKVACAGHAPVWMAEAGRGCFSCPQEESSHSPRAQAEHISLKLNTSSWRGTPGPGREKQVTVNPNLSKSPSHIGKAAGLPPELPCREVGRGVLRDKACSWQETLLQQRRLPPARTRRAHKAQPPRHVSAHV